MRERQTGLSQGFAFLEFTSHAAAQEVLNAFDGKQIPNTAHLLRLNWAAFGLGRNLEGMQTLLPGESVDDNPFGKQARLSEIVGTKPGRDPL